MEKYKLQSGEESDKIFVIKRSEIEGRIEAEYYKPSIRLLEYKIRKKASKKLKDFALKMASGATPSVTEEDKYYSDKENGVPFLRVQNLQTNGELALDDVKYINKTTHQTMLKRSQVAEHDLLIKITGVGRMAIASVAPDEFVGNTNQHMVVMKTASEDISRYLAKYLNLDIVEKLASRRSTGATRPALDYSALKSIPIVEKIDFSVIEKAHKQRLLMYEEAKKNIQDIDTFLEAALGLSISQYPFERENKSDLINFSKLSGYRLDPNYNFKYEYLINQKSNYKFVPLKNLLVASPQYGANEQAIDDFERVKPRYVRITDIDEYGRLKNEGYVTANKIESKYLLQQDDILFARSGSVGKCYLHGEVEYDCIFAGYLIRFKVDTTQILPAYLFYYCTSNLYKFWVNAIERPAVQSNINSEEFKSLPVPLPTISEQHKIVDTINLMREKAFKLFKEGDRIVDQAKQHVESKIISL